VISGAQIRQARKLLGWERSKLGRWAKVHSLIVERTESVATEPPITKTASMLSAAAARSHPVSLLVLLALAARVLHGPLVGREHLRCDALNSSGDRRRPHSQSRGLQKRRDQFWVSLREPLAERGVDLRDRRPEVLTHEPRRLLLQVGIEVAVVVGLRCR